MSQIKKILIPTDFSSTSESALNYASNFAKEDAPIEITLLHISESEPTAEHKKELDNKFQEIRDKFQFSLKLLFSFVIKSGPLTETILNFQAENGSDLIIMGTKGSIEEEEVAATNTSKLVLEADCPVLVIPVKTKTFAMKNIALALGKDEIDDSSALGVLQDIARKFDAIVHILTISNEENSIILEENNESILDYYLELLDYRYVFPKDSNIEKGISEYIKEKDIDMLAILPRNHAKKSRPSEGRLTKLLTLHTDVPLLTID